MVRLPLSPQSGAFRYRDIPGAELGERWKKSGQAGCESTLENGSKDSLQVTPFRKMCD